jgi:enterochelin esterase-like enzyme
LRERGIAHDYAEHAGGHDWTYWRRHVADSLTFVGTRVAGVAEA